MQKDKNLLLELDEFMNDDFNTAKVLANLFELVPVINSIKDKHIALLHAERSPPWTCCSNTSKDR